MRVAIDGRSWGWAGVGRYVQSLVSALLKEDDSNRYILCVAPEKLTEAKAIYSQWLENKLEINEISGSYYSWEEQWQVARDMGQVKADLWHWPHFNVPLAWRKPFVVTVHDITRFNFPGQVDASWMKQIMYEQVMARAVRKAQRVITVSNASKQDLLALPLKSVEISVIHEGVDQKFALGDFPRENFILVVGVWMNHKNLRRVLEAFRMVSKTKPDLKLVMTGEAKIGYVPVKKIISELGLMEKVELVGKVSDEELLGLYQKTRVFVMASLYEGFGLPALEAAACGSSVVVSNVSSLPEIVPEAVFVNPESVESIATGIIRGLVGEGRCEVDRPYWSWERVAREHVAVYRGATVK